MNEKEKTISLVYSLEDYIKGIIVAFEAGLISTEKAQMEINSGIKSWTWGVSTYGKKEI